ncbi:MAG: OmpA family protein, partial [Polyangiaceae bacterium]|nr:OmpA family protein [Polyangiaceae bacterium]
MLLSRYVIRAALGDFRARILRPGEPVSAADEDASHSAWFSFNWRIGTRDQEAVAAAMELCRELPGASFHLQSGPLDDFAIEELRRRLGFAVRSGRIVFEPEEKVMVRGRHERAEPIAASLAPLQSPPSPPGPELERELTWFEVTLVDDTGQPIPNVRLVSGAISGTLVTNGAGTARVEDQTSSFAWVSFADAAALEEELRQRWALPGRRRAVPSGAKEVDGVAPFPGLQLESEVPLVVALVPPRHLVHYARHQAPSAGPIGKILPIWGQATPSYVDETPLPAVAAILRYAAGTTDRHRLLVAGRGGITDEPLLQSVALLAKGNREAWVQDAVGRHDVADYQRALLWIANARRYGCYLREVGGSWDAPTKNALGRFRVAHNLEHGTALVEDETPRPEEDFGAFFDSFNRYFCESLSLEAAELAEAQQLLELHDAAQLLGDRDPTNPEAPVTADGIDLFLVRARDAAGLPAGDATEQLCDAERFGFDELSTQVPEPQCKVTYVLDVEDVHFNHDHFILMPNDTLEDEDNLQAERGLTGLHVLAAAIRHAEAHPKREMLVVGHTDSTGSTSYNLPLSEERAKSVFFVLGGAVYKEDWVMSSNRDPEERFDDNRRILKWANERFAYDCDPGNTTGPVTNQYYQAVRNFQDRYNGDVYLLAETGNPFAPLYAEKIPPHERGWVGAKTWGAFFDCYQRELMRLTEKDMYSKLQEAQQAISLVKPRPVYGCGEYHPRDPARRQAKREAGYPDEQGERTPDDRRVEVLFFDPGEAPPFPCHPTTDPQSCFPHVCFLYDNAFYVHRRLPADGVGEQATVALERVEVKRDGVYIDGDTFCPPLDEDVRFTVRISSLSIPFEGAITLVIVRETTDGPSTVARISHDFCAFESSEVVLMFRWHGRATVEVPRAVSTQTTMDV